ncbi:hypothetical protein EV175_003238 [Coemansia sp. RSA 1933]|nr:hypothetical protein EV175_003238 [Coemansia sp. RSA 1933]
MPNKSADLQSHDDTDYGVIEKAGMAFGHSPSGLLLPGIDKTTEREAIRLCARDYLEHHVYWNEAQFHNHLNNHLLAVFSMGASPKRLQEIFDGNRTMQRPTMPLHETEINASNFTEFLTKEENYPRFLAFFRKELDAAGDDWHAVVKKYTIDSGMFTYLMSGIYHPFIQLGYGLEFDSKAITAMALAQTCVHNPRISESYYSESFEEMRANLASSPDNDVSLLQILEKLRDERSVADIEFKPFIFFGENVGLGNHLAAKYGKLWTINADEKAISTKYDELLSTAALLYISMTRPGHKQILNFFAMHCLTSAYFLPIIFEILSTEQKARVLHAHSTVMLQLYSLIGAPKVHITPEHIADDANAVASKLYGESDANPWLDVFRDAINHTDIHVPKVIRALWRGNVLSTLREDGAEQKTPSVNWLYIARTTLDTITTDSFVPPNDEKNKGKQFFNIEMCGYDQSWESHEKS